MKRMEVIPRRADKETTPQGAATAVQRLLRVMGKLGIAAYKGPPVDPSQLPDLGRVRDTALRLRARAALAAGELFPAETAPAAALLKRIAEDLEELIVSWSLYEVATAHLLGTADLQLALSPAHRLVRRRVVPALLAVLEEDPLPEAERDDLEVLLGEIRVVVGDEVARLQESRARSQDEQAQAQRDLESLRAEEHLLDVMLAMKQGISPGLGDMLQASKTYERLVSESAGEGGDDPDEDEDDRRGSSR